MRILVTRPLPDGERTAAAVRARGHQVLLAPLMKVKPMPADLSGAWSAVIVSSANALRAHDLTQIALLKALPLFAVGERSADAARQAGFVDVRSARGDANDLVRLVVDRCTSQAEPHLYLAGDDRAADIEGELTKRGIKARTIVVYKNVTVGFPPELVRALEAGALDGVLHFSRRSADNYLSGASDAGLSARALALRHFCISAQVAEPLRAAGARDIKLAGRPDEASVLELLTASSP
jgi:uroporphyrinogen-III synthase